MKRRLHWAALMAAGLLSLGAADAQAQPRTFEDPILSFEDPILSFEDPILSFEDPILSFEDPILSFEDPILSFEDPILSFEDPIWFDVPIISLDASLRSMEGTLDSFAEATRTCSKTSSKPLDAKQRAALRKSIRAQLALVLDLHKKAVADLRKAGKGGLAQQLMKLRPELTRESKRWAASSKQDLKQAKGRIESLREGVERIGAKTGSHFALRSRVVLVASRLARMHRFVVKGRLCAECWPDLDGLAAMLAEQKADPSAVRRLRQAVQRGQAAGTAREARAALRDAGRALTEIAKALGPKKGKSG